jgi:SAM-dependent methyltransferase
MMFKSNNVDRPSMKILSTLREHDDFMESIRTLVDLGCGSGEDLSWWATQTTREDSPRPLNIRCWGVDTVDQLGPVKKHPNVTYQATDFETVVHPPKDQFDVLWCHDAFQYCIDPLGTLTKWRDIASEGAMLVIAVPETMRVQQRQLAFHLPSGVIYHYTVASLIHMLALTGWDCRSGFFQQPAGDPWIRAVVYKTNKPVLDPKKTTWYDLVADQRLPESAERSIHAHGYLRQQDLVVPWLDHNLSWLGKV